MAYIPAAPQKSKGGLKKISDTSLRRFAHKAPTARSQFKKPNAAYTEARTIFPKSVVDAEMSPRLLVWGHNSSKIGGRITKGRWVDSCVYTLTLEERATCPSSCLQWESCYGNNMHWARRHRDDGWLMTLLWYELKELNRKHHKTGFAVRLHVLGDFYSPEYARFWGLALAEFPNLRIFGFTAHDRNSEIGGILNALNLSEPRCSIRFSNSTGPMGSVVIEQEADHLPTSGHIICPAQLEKTLTCGTCGLCWSTDKVIEFIRH